MKELLARAWPGAWPAAQLIAQLFDLDFLQKLDLLKGFLGAAPHLIAFLGFAIFLIVGSLYLVSYPAATAAIERLRKPVYRIVVLSFLVSLNLVLINLPDWAFLSNLTPARLWFTLIAYLLCFWGLGILLASRALGAALRRTTP